jgi:hypothetical protein
MLLRGGPSFLIEEQAFSTHMRGAESNPARVNARGVWHDSFFKHSNLTEV